MSSYFLPYQNSFSVSRPRGLRGFPHLAVRAAVERGFAQLGSEDFAEDPILRVHVSVCVFVHQFLLAVLFIYLSSVIVTAAF